MVVSGACNQSQNNAAGAADWGAVQKKGFVEVESDFNELDGFRPFDIGNASQWFHASTLARLARAVCYPAKGDRVRRIN